MCKAKEIRCQDILGIIYDVFGVALLVVGTVGFTSVSYIEVDFYIFAIASGFLCVCVGIMWMCYTKVFTLEESRSCLVRAVLLLNTLAFLLVIPGVVLSGNAVKFGCRSDEVKKCNFDLSKAKNFSLVMTSMVLFCLTLIPLFFFCALFFVVIISYIVEFCSSSSDSNQRNERTASERQRRRDQDRRETVIHEFVHSADYNSATHYGRPPPEYNTLAAVENPLPSHERQGTTIFSPPPSYSSLGFVNHI